MILHLFIYFTILKFLLASEDKVKSNIELSLSYSSQFIAFIESYRETNIKFNFNHGLQYSNDNTETFNPKNLQQISGQVTSNKIQNNNAIQAFVSIPEQNKHIQMQVFMGSRLQPYKLTFDLNYPYIWVKSPNCQICQEKKLNSTNTTLPVPNSPPSAPEKNSSQVIQQHYKKEIRHNLFQQAIPQEEQFTNCTEVKQYIQKGNFFSCDPKNTTCRLLQTNQVIRYTTPRPSSYNNNSSNLTEIEQNESSKYVIGDLVNDAITFQKDVVTILFKDFYVINQEINVEPMDLLIQNDGFIGFPIIKNNSIVQQLYDQKTINRNSFSLYLYYEPTNAIQPCVILGDNNKNYYQGDFNYTKMWNFENKYAFHFKKLNLGNISFHEITPKNLTTSQIQLKKEIPHKNKKSKIKQLNFIDSNNTTTPTTTTANKTEIIQEQEYVGILSTQEFLIKFPEKVIINLMNVMKDNFNILCRKDVNKTVECIKDKNSTMPDLSIEVNHPDEAVGNQFIHLKGEWYIWECKQSLDNSDLSKYTPVDQTFVSSVSKNITQYQVCRTFFQVSDESTYFQNFFGFSFMERFYIEFDLDKQTLAFSQSVRKSSLAAAVPNDSILLVIGPLFLIAFTLFFFYQFKVKSKHLKTQNQSQSKIELNKEIQIQIQ